MSGKWGVKLAVIDNENFIIPHHSRLGRSEIAEKLPNRLDLHNDFQEAEGEVEFTVDGTCIHTRDENGKPQWREMKVDAVLKRPCGGNVVPSQWDSADRARVVSSPNEYFEETVATK